MYVPHGIYAYSSCWGPRSCSGPTHGQPMSLHFGPVTPCTLAYLTELWPTFKKFGPLRVPACARPILTHCTLQTAVTRSVMVRLEKFLQFWNGHDVASRGGASDTRLRSRRVCRSLYTTPLIVFICPYHIRVLERFVLMSITPSFMKIFRRRSGGHARRQWLTSPKITTLWGHGLGEKWGFERKIFFPATFLPLSQDYVVDTWRLDHSLNTAVLSHTVSELWGVKNFRQKTSNPRIAKSGR
jgi:hypothetical protein